MGRIVIAMVLAVLLTASVAEAAPEFAVSVTGSRQGPFKGETTRKGFEGKIVGLSFDQELISPRDPVTGQATGRQVYKPIRIKKAWGPASLQFFLALTTNELLTVVVMDFFATDPSGLLVLDHTVKLTNAAVASYRSHADSDVTPGAPQTDVIEFVFQKIEITDYRNKGGVSDTWMAAPM